MTGVTHNEYLTRSVQPLGARYTLSIAKGSEVDTSNFLNLPIPLTVVTATLEQSCFITSEYT